ncbi:hypothetical protein NV64_17960 [Erwinia sp. B116]|nr:hypothetical protein NV64_17960 [Erwinia sp. B116]
MLKQDVTVLKQDVTVLKQDVTVLKQDVTVLKQDVTVLKQDVSVLKEDVKILKEDVNGIKIDVAVIKSNYVTKEEFHQLDKKFDTKFEMLRSELHQSLASQTKWFAASQMALLVVGLGAAKIIF